MSRTANRFTGAFLAILIQAGLLALLLLARPTVAPPQSLVRELTFILPRLTVPKAETARPTIDARSRPRPVVPAPAIAPPPPAISATTAPSPDLGALGQSIFGCDAGSRSSLPPEQRARCPRLGDGAGGAGGARSQVKDYTHWAAELAARNTPFRVPCTRIETNDLGFGHQEQVLMADPLCLLKQGQ